MTEGARRWIRDLAGQFQAAGIPASFAFSMEVYRPPVEMAARYWDGAPVDLPMPSTQMHFGAQERAYLKQMYRECADEIAAAGLPMVLQFGETQWWFDSPGALGFYVRSGFVPYARKVEVFDDPRLRGLLPRSAAPQVPLIEGTGGRNSGSSERRLD